LRTAEDTQEDDVAPPPLSTSMASVAAWLSERDCGLLGHGAIAATPAHLDEDAEVAIADAEAEEEDDAELLGEVSMNPSPVGDDALWGEPMAWSWK